VTQVALVDPVSAGTITAPKLASVVARHIEDDVVARGWPVGTVLGSETDLLERYGVSRAVLREAVRIVEHTGAARMRRGPGGGLVVSEPDRGAVVTAMSVWFSYVGVTIMEMLEVRRPLITAAARLAAERRTGDDATELVERIDAIAAGGVVGPPQLNTLEAAVVAVAGNPALALFIEAVGDLGVTRLASGRARLDPPLTAVEGLAHLEGYRPVVAAIADGDGVAAARRVNRLIDAVASRLRDATPRRASRRRLDDLSPGKLAERVADALRDDIERAGWPVGQVIGSETDLIERYGVSRAILREGVRIVEHHGAVRTKRGPRGGLVVTAPDSGAIVRSARMILEYDGVAGEQLFEARSVLEVAAVRLAAERATSEEAAVLLAAIETEERVGDAAERFMPVHHRLAAATGNRPFELFVDVMGELVPSRVRAERRTPQGVATLSTEVHWAHDKIVEAVIAGDADLAERLMRRHLEASVDVLE
jgi:DNA-binding FadR family transcriptional regulator